MSLCSYKDIREEVFLPYNDLINPMEQKLKKAFKNLKILSNSDLSGKIWLSVLTRQKKIFKFETAGLFVAGAFSLVFLIPAGRWLIEAFSKSGFYEYLSLIFSDGKYVFSSLGDFLNLLAESLPGFEISIFLASLFIFFVSAKYVSRRVSGLSEMNRSAFIIN